MGTGNETLTDPNEEMIKGVRDVSFGDCLLGPEE